MKGKPIYKRWWFWVGIVVIIIIIATTSGGNDKGPGTADNRENAKKNEEGAEQPDKRPAEETDEEGAEQQDKKTTEETDGRNTEQEDKEAPVIEFSNVVVQSRYGTTMVVGEAVNNDDKAHSFTIKVSFYDEGGKLLGTAAGAMNDINGG